MRVAVSMPLMTTVPRMRRDAAPEPSAIHSGTQPRMKANDVIRIGRRRKLSAFERGDDQLFTFVHARLRELDDKDGVLRSEADEHDDADLGVDVEIEPPHQETGEGANYSNWNGQKDGEGQRPALVKRSQNQKYENDRQSEESRSV